MRITEEHYRQLVDDGYTILHNFIPRDELAELQAAQRRVLKSWDQVKDNPPPNGDAYVPYPYPDPLMSKLYLDPEFVTLAKRYLKTNEVVANVGYMLARYPGFKSGDAGHIDNGNNSLLPQSRDNREFSQLVFWTHLEEVKPGQAPLLLVKHKHGRDLTKAEPFVCPAGSTCIFTNYTFHASSPYTLSEGQRFTWAFMMGRRDHVWESLLSYTSIGQRDVFRKVVSSLTPEQRTMFRFPPPGHRYYTRQTLAALEEQYPGFNASGAYLPVD